MNRFPVSTRESKRCFKHERLNRKSRKVRHVSGRERGRVLDRVRVRDFGRGLGRELARELARDYGRVFGRVTGRGFEHEQVRALGSGCGPLFQTAFRFRSCPPGVAVSMKTTLEKATKAVKSQLVGSTEYSFMISAVNWAVSRAVCSTLLAAVNSTVFDAVYDAVRLPVIRAVYGTVYAALDRE